MPANLENSALTPGLEKVSFHFSPTERQCQRTCELLHSCTQFSPVAQLCATLCNPLACSTNQASLSITSSRSLLTLISIELMIPSNHFILCPPLLPPSIFPILGSFPMSQFFTLISHASKVMLKILQAKLQQYMNSELPDVQAGFRKSRERPEIKFPTFVGSLKKQENSRKSYIYSVTSIFFSGSFPLLIIMIF